MLCAVSKFMKHPLIIWHGDFYQKCKSTIIDIFQDMHILKRCLTAMICDSRSKDLSLESFSCRHHFFKERFLWKPYAKRKNH